MRDNNKWCVLYEKELDEAGITPEMELDDILELIRGRSGWYDTFREKLKTFAEHMRSRDAVKQGRRRITFDEYATSVICMPVHRMDSIQKRRPWIETPIDDKSKRVRYDLTEDEAKECRLLHWIYIEMETIDSRTRAQRA